MEAACEHTKGAMCSIIGLDDAAVEEICANTDGYVIPANYNCPGQLVISGEADSVERAAAACAEKGARTVKLNVSGAFHSKLMEYRESGEDKDSLSEILQSFEFSPPSIDFYLNISGEKIPDTVKENALNLRAFMVDYIVRQMSSPVKFRATLENMERDGVDNFIEIGVGKVLSGFVRRTCKTAKFSNFEYHK